jgi:hypothetical protein
MLVVPLSRQQFKVFNTVVVLVAIEMMNNLIRPRHATMMFPPHDLMLISISPAILLSRVVFWRHLHDIGPVTHQPSPG